MKGFLLPNMDRLSNQTMPGGSSFADTGNLCSVSGGLCSSIRVLQLAVECQQFQFPIQRQFEVSGVIAAESVILGQRRDGGCFRFEGDVLDREAAEIVQHFLQLEFAQASGFPSLTSACLCA